tara:strand:+ start:618 stop:1055 length:438 start_codon:yes stop_codon:yes gene_type:complete
MNIKKINVSILIIFIQSFIFFYILSRNFEFLQHENTLEHQLYEEMREAYKEYESVYNESPRNIAFLDQFHQFIILDGNIGFEWDADKRRIIYTPKEPLYFPNSVSLFKLFFKKPRIVARYIGPSSSNFSQASQQQKIDLNTKFEK